MVAPVQLDPEIIREFISESDENISALERELVGWEKQPNSQETLECIFRAFHSLKGTGGLLGFEHLESVVHQAENVLSSIRAGHLAVNTETVTAFLKTLDALRILLKQIEETGEEEEGGYEVLVAELNLKTLQKQVINQAELQKQKAVQELNSSQMTETIIRVKAEMLDQLMKLAQQLEQERDQVAQAAAATNDPGLTETSRRLSRLIADFFVNLQKMRQQPLETIWNKFPRLIRDAALDGGKKIRLETSGDQIEIDRSMLESIRDALTHIVRNSIDHGIETPEKRLAAGKTEEGRISLRAAEQENHVLIEVEDDGAGLQLDLIREAALQRALITAEQALTLSDHDLHHLIFLPGFSTAADPTKLSGRGVGMNVVKTNLERIQGQVEIISRPGQGALFRITIPRQNAAISSLVEPP